MTAAPRAMAMSCAKERAANLVADAATKTTAGETWAHVVE
jgi:hypothetical protein